MKKKIFSLMTAVCMLGMFTSCSDDDPTPNPTPNPEPDTPEVHYPGEDLTAKKYNGTALVITDGDNAMTGKTAEFTPATNGTATLTLKGEALNLTDLIGGAMSKADDALMLPTPGVVPGSPSVTIPLELKGETDTCSFNGTFDAEYCTFNYSGSVGANVLQVKISDVKLKDASLAGTYAVPTDYLEVDYWGDNVINVNRLFRIQWESEKKLMDILPVADVVRLALQLVTQPGADGEALPLPVLYANILKNVTFGEDGSVTAVYCDTDKDGWPETTAPKGMASYVVKENGTALVFIDPMAVITNVMANTSKSRAADMDAIMDALINDVLPMCQNGIPVTYGPALVDTGETDENNNPIYGPSDDANAYSFYLGTDVLLPILKIAAPVLTDDAVVNMIVEAAKKDPTMGFMADMLPDILKSVPEIINTTTKVEIGVNLDRQ